MDVIPTFAEGTVINGYKLIRLLGQGSFSNVYQVVRVETNERFALKIIPRDRVVDEGDFVRLQREVDAMAFLRNEFIIQLWDFFSDGSNFYLVTDLCKGGSLVDVLTSSTPLRDTQCATVFLQILKGIQYCHSLGVAHRDLKPANILFTSFPALKIGDFGLCGFVSESEKMSTFCGSPFYSAPECIKRIGYDGRKADIWSLGVILFEIATRKHPWATGNIPKMIKQITTAQYHIPPEVGTACSDLIRSLLRIKPADRPTINQILNHPWLKLAPAKFHNHSQSLPPLWPELSTTQNCTSMKAFTESIERKDSKGEIMNPLESISSPLVEQPPPSVPSPISSFRPNSRVVVHSRVRAQSGMTNLSNPSSVRAFGHTGPLAGPVSSPGFTGRSSKKITHFGTTGTLQQIHDSRLLLN